MHDSAFAATARQGSAVILRLPMRPYSIGHELLLLAQQNPLLYAREYFDNLSPALQRLAVIRAALVCYRTWNQNQQPERHLRLWGWRIRKDDFALAIAEFRNYRAAGSACPPTPTKENYKIAAGKPDAEFGREFGGCYYAKLVAHFSRGGMFSALGHETAFDVPLGFANYVYLSELELDGMALIENEREAQVAAEMDEARRQAAAEKEAQCQP